MRIILDEPEDNESYDVRQIVEACERHGYQISPTDARKAWDRFSKSMAAGWMHVPEDDAEIVATVLSYCRAEM